MPESVKKCIVLGVTAGIAIYKSADLCSKLTGAGYDVRVVMTPHAQELMSSRIFFTLSRHPVFCDLFETSEWEPEHIDLAERGDLLLVAPATANFIGKYANGIADDPLTTTAVAYRKKVLIAPAMNSRMWSNPAVQENCAKLKSRGVEFVGPGSGRLACGTIGEGRMSEVPEIMDAVRKILGEA